MIHSHQLATYLRAAQKLATRLKAVSAASIQGRAARKYVASWWLWIILDVLYTGVFLYKALYLTAGLYAGFVVLAIYGLLAWQRELHDEPPSAPALAGNS